VSPVRAVALGAELPRTMRGDEPAVSMQSIGGFQVRDPGGRGIPADVRGQQGSRPAGHRRETFEAMAMLQSIQKQPYTPAPARIIPRGRLGDSLKQIAQLIKADVGMEMAFADIGNWDHHVNEVGQRAFRGQLADLLRTSARR
jgi:hypothetical protein